jgi:glycosyltransferase involved in cell wall biosynthesis
MSSGLPAIVVNRGGVRDQVTDGVNGFICPEDAHAFAHATLRLRDEAELRHHLALNARQTAERSPWTTVMGQLEDYYNEAISLNNRYNRMYPSLNPLQRLLVAG